MKDNFTLVELLIVFILIGIWGMMAVPINRHTEQSVVDRQEPIVVLLDPQPESEVNVK